MPRLHRPHVAPRARSLTVLTAQRARRAKWELAVLIPLFGLTVAAYLERERIFGVDTPGYASLLIAILLMGAIQLLSLGIIGEYLGRLFVEVKARPIYVVEGVYEDVPPAPPAT